MTVRSVSAIEQVSQELRQADPCVSVEVHESRLELIDASFFRKSESRPKQSFSGTILDYLREHRDRVSGQNKLKFTEDCLKHP